MAADDAAPEPTTVGPIPDVRPRDLPPVERWNQQAWPPITFGVPAEWTDVPPERFAWLPPERRIPPLAPLHQQSTILAAVEHAGSQDHGWQVQLRLLENTALARYVIENPARWAQGARLLGEANAAAEHVRVCGCPAVVLRYDCRLAEGAFVFHEAWLIHPDKGYYFVGSAPAEDEPSWRKAWETMLENTQEQGGYPFAVRASTSAPTAAAALVAPPPTAVERYRCGVDAQVPVTLENVTSQRPGGMFIIGSASTAAWALLASAGMTLWGKARAAGLEGQTRMVPAAGDAVLMEDRVVLRLVVAAKVSGVRLRGDAASRSIELAIPYRLIRRCGTDQRGVSLDLVGRGVLRLEPNDPGAFAQWLAHLSYERTWRPPSTLGLRVERPVVGWCQQDPRFTFGLPQGWVPADPGPLADFGRFFHPSALRAGVLLGVGDWEAQVFVIEIGPAQSYVPKVDAESLAALLASATEISPTGALQAAAIGGETVALLRGTSATSEGAFDRCYGAFTHGGVLYALWYGVVGGRIGDGSYERWLPDFHSMMATWHWYA